MRGRRARRSAWRLGATVAGVLALGACAGSRPGSPDAGTALALPLSTADLAEVLVAGRLTALRFDDASVMLKQDGLQILIFVEDAGESLQAVLPYTGRGAGDPERVAAWNAGRRFGRAYIDEDGAPVLASDLMLGPGTSADAVRSWCRVVIALAGAFRDEVWPAPAPPAVPRGE
ncbi:MAG TPA: YbjN domain-containing protein [Candidatus Krumholzibacteria bacterium]|nr:YbjN domain-containing protein [Candidatus Krumholzibacteria bacterium]HPD70601.1 YbjN domain-containing protein [Candidatus Krumholzibacteria bacterium]HRY39699.1 YbjN domain-containing protein [Candidatus Krumholzibacteria bacterium]